jgi:hypothetical protein
MVSAVQRPGVVTQLLGLAVNRASQDTVEKRRNAGPIDFMGDSFVLL